MIKITGNPLNCDCETLWLRNWISSERNVVGDEPICYSPKALTGNPFKKLRTSRFTCSNKRSDDSVVIRDACLGIPPKTPIRQQIKDTLASAGGYFNPEIVQEDSPVPAMLHDDDTDVVDVDDTEKSDSNVYEYYYVYYDDEGNVVNKTEDSQTTQTVKNEPEDPKIEEESSDVTSGDTPTIYAQITNMTKHDEQKVEEEPEEEGLKIFGIPIPKIPLPILSFGLSPALSHGLLPIGRKGDPSADIVSGPIRRTRLPPPTRGPDSQEPIWVDSKEYSTPLHPQRPVHSSTESKKTRPYGYLRPVNPIIPIGEASYFPSESNAITKRQPPVIKFDHPSSGNRHSHLPIVPVPDLRTPHQPIKVRDTVDGFVPIFKPGKLSLDFTPSSLPRDQPSAFPGVDATLDQSYQTVPKVETTEPPVVWGKSPFGGLEDQGLGVEVQPNLGPGVEFEYEYYDEYEDKGQDVVSQASTIIMTTSTTQASSQPSTTTERIVPTLSIEEIDEPETRGSQQDSKPEQEYEYEYYYEYYDAENETSTENSMEEKEVTVSSANDEEAPVSLQNLLQLINEDNDETTEDFASTVESLMAENLLGDDQDENDNIKGNPPFVSSTTETTRPTPPTPIRTSTLEPFDNNYLESKRSTVAVNFKEEIQDRRDEFFRKWQESVAKQAEKKQEPRSSSGQPVVETTSENYPFHPDQLDPAAAVDGGERNNDVKWYYSNYNNEDRNPFVSPSKAEPPSESSSDSTATSIPMIISCLAYHLLF